MVSTTSDPVAAVRALQPDIRAAAEQTERDRKPTAAIIEKLLDAGLFDVIKPKSIGGAETDVITMMRIIEEASIADASIGWCVGIGVGTSIIAGSVSEAVAREVFAPKTVQGGAFAPTGRGTLERGGIRVTGRWQFASGSPHCSWLSGGTIIFDGAAPRMMAPDMPDWRMPLFPRADVELIDTWHTGGMRGTGSNDIAVKDLFVPDDHVVMMGRTEPVQTGPLYRYPIIGFLALTIAPVATGMARRALDETLALAQTKVALGTRKTVKDRHRTASAGRSGGGVARRPRLHVRSGARDLGHDGPGRHGDDAAARKPAALLRACDERIGKGRRHRVSHGWRHGDLRDERAAAHHARRAHRDAARPALDQQLRGRRPRAHGFGSGAVPVLKPVGDARKATLNQGLGKLVAVQAQEEALLDLDVVQLRVSAPNSQPSAVSREVGHVAGHLEALDRASPSKNLTLALFDRGRCVIHSTAASRQISSRRISLTRRSTYVRSMVGSLRIFRTSLSCISEWLSFAQYSLAMIRSSAEITCTS